MSEQPSGFRWWLFKKLSAIGWWVCPEPHKSRLQSVLPHWPEAEAEMASFADQCERDVGMQSPEYDKWLASLSESAARNFARKDTP